MCCVVLCCDSRSRAFIILHLLLELLVYGEFSYEVFGFCREMDTTLGSLAVPYVLLAVKSGLFYLCITSDPGRRGCVERRGGEKRRGSEGRMC